MSHRAYVAAFLLLAPLAAQGDPQVPPGGFQIIERLDRSMAFSDAYKTCVDIRLPAFAAPSGGWPGVVVCHGNGGSRKKVAALARRLAAAGYVTLAHDHRTQGCTPQLNPTAPTTYPGERNLLDFAEAFVVLEQRLTTALDSTRLAMVGTSMGAGHSYAGAAWSGRQLPLAGWVNRFPRLRAVAGQIGVIDKIANAVPGNRLLRATLVENLAQYPADPRWIAADAARYDVLANLLAVDPISNRGALLRTSDVPVYARQGYEDSKHPPAMTLDALLGMRPGVPFKGFATGNGHGVPTRNKIEGALYEDDVVRWFDRFLKQRSNGILQEPEFEAAVTPLDPRYADASSEWEHRFSATWPARTPATRYFLRGDGSLSASAPVGVEPGRALRHRVPASYDLAEFVRTSRSGQNAAAVMQAIPMVSHDFAGPVLTRSTELFGRPEVAFSVRSSTGDFQISAALLVRHPNSSERFLAGGTAAVRGQAAGIHRVEIDLRDVTTILPAGSRLVLRVENLSHRRTPSQSFIEFVPWLGDVDMGLVIAPQAPATVELPIRAARGLGVTPRLAKVSAAGGFDHPLHVAAGPERSGRPYFLFLSTSGFGPGVQYAGATIPLNVDATTDIGLQLINTPALPGFAGSLDARGQATGRIRLPAAPAAAMVGLRFTFAGMVLEQNGVVAGGPAQLDILP